MSETPPSSEPLIAGKYQLVRMIGRGGMGSVWEARHATLGTPSAIKFIESEYADSHEARSRFDKEAKAAATIQSKHAIQIYDHGVTEDGKPYIVMELLQGEPLDKRIDRLGRMTLQDTARIIQQVCRGLARAHERGIIHRDLKPENIFIVRTPDDDEEVAKVLDFGIAKMSNSPGSPGITSSTKTGAVLGTPFYMSPEQARGLRNVDHRTDVWSLGVIAYKCIVGKLPFDGESVGDLLVKICTAPLPVPSQQLPGIPPNFDAWFMRALEREPERRFSTATELSDALAFAAGIATRGAGPFSQAGSTAAMPSGPMTQTPQPSFQTPPGYPPAPGVGPGAAMTPPPGAMTNAPFTSERVAGVPSGSGKVIGGAIAAVLLLAVAGAGFVFKDRLLGARPAGITAAAASPSASSTPPPSAPPPAAVTPSTEPASAPPEPPPAEADAGAVAAATPAAATKPSTTKPSGGSTSPKPPPPSPKPNVTPPPLPPPPGPAPAPTTTTKKPNKNDPGY